MKKVSVDILISNSNSYEAIQLCIESIRRYTKHKNYQIIVYDDASENEVDLIYLREKQKLGWLRLIEGKRKIDHGGALNRLINKECRADYAVIIDCDLQIIAEDWLCDMIEQASKSKEILAVCTTYKTQVRGSGTWLAPFAEFWFGIIDMTAYRDGMKTDWRCYYTKDKRKMRQIVESDCSIEPIDRLAVDVGSKLILRLKKNNKKGYYIKSPMPKEIEKKYYHYHQISCLYGDSSEHIDKYMGKQFEIMRHCLGRLR